MQTLADTPAHVTASVPVDGRPTIGIVGCGFVGQALLRLFGDCPVYDPAKGHTDKDAINRSRFAFVCVPTPTGPDGECDVSIVEETVRWIESEIIVIRSTGVPGTTDLLTFGLDFEETRYAHLLSQPPRHLRDMPAAVLVRLHRKAGS
jgi:hypothetical protein